MQIQIRSRGVERDEQLTQHVLRHLHFALGRFAPRVRNVEVLLGDANGPRGGLDGECRVMVRTGAGGKVVVEELHEDLFSAIARAADRAGRAVARQVDAHHAGSRRPRAAMRAGR